MLTTEDIQRLFGYIRETHPNCPRSAIPRLTHGMARQWISALAPYSYEQAVEAVDRQAQVSRFWPDLAEIMAQLPAVSQMERSRRETDPSSSAAGRKLREWRERYQNALRAAGLPTSAEASAGGMTMEEWGRLTAGVRIEDYEEE